ncbi:nucleoside phosphorylase [Geomonas sp.]|uniref:phosphorylase family protein n=1 Tax=Geomonas sp. TaxID=2651584 RepID=UPI002B476231|nr:nucleoside phosphorylase [Geomonas sp.]HJV34439.1 nucleoside phosphorylase [Geomonas sp.]
MNKDCIGVIAAMPEEIAPLLGRVRDVRKDKVGGFNVYRFSTGGGTPVVLVESGMGPKHAAAATKLLIEQESLRVIVNFGFGGGVLPGLEVGELVLAERVLLLETGGVSEAAGCDPALCDPLIESCRSAGIALKRGTFITAASIMNKKEVAEKFPGMTNPVLEMETAAVAATARRAGIPVVAVRGISDAADEELGFSLEEFCDAELNIRIGRVLWCLAKRPWIIPQLLRLASNTKRAGKMLAPCLELLLEKI